MNKELNYPSKVKDMIIKRLELQGFKSFNERTKVVFHPGITAVVGPNGTGKSNIVDALLWVLSGKRLKALRGERSGDIIFNGNAKNPPLNMADVSIFLGDDDEEDTVINHRVFRSGDGEYRLNGKVVRLKDIQDHLWKKAIGETEYFVIEQGSIGLFLGSKPQEKRVLLEEAAGTAFYKEKKRQAQRKLENSELNLARLEDIIVEVERAKNALKRQASAAIRYRQLRERIRELTLYQFRIKIHKLEGEQRETVQGYQKSMENENLIGSRLKTDEKNLAEKRNAVWNLEKANKDEREKLFSLKTELSQFEAEQDTEEKRIDYFNEAGTKAKSNKEDFLQEIITLKEELEKEENNLQTLNTSLNEKQSELDKVDHVALTSDEILKETQARIENLRGELLQKLSIQTEIKNEASRVEKEIELILRQEEKLKNQLAEEKELLESKNTEINKNTQELGQYQKNWQEKLEKTEVDKETLGTQSSTIEGLQDTLKDLSLKKDKSLHHLNALEKLEEKERSTDISDAIPGAMGLLADLIDADAKNAPLVDVFWKEEAKANLIQAGEFLRNLPQGEPKGNYLLIADKRAEALPSRLSADTRVVGLLKAAVRPNPRAKNSVAQLEEAVIVKDIKTAVDLWLNYPEASFITEKGDLLLSSGLLKLGPKKEGIIALSQEIKTIEDKIGQLDQKIAPLTKQIDDLLGEKAQLEDEVQQDTVLLTSLERSIAEKEKDKKFDHSEKDKIESNIFLFERELRVLQEEKQEKSQKLDKLMVEIKTLEEEEATLKDESQKEESKISNLRRRREEKKDLFFELQSRVDILKEKISSTENQTQSMRLRIKTTEGKIGSLEEEIQRLEEQKAQSKETMKDFGEKALVLERKIKEREKQLLESESDFRQVQQDEKNLEAQIDEIRKVLEERSEERVQWEVKKAERDRDIANLEESCWQELKKTQEEVKKEVELETVLNVRVEEELTQAEQKLQKFQAVNLAAEEEYLIQKERFDFLSTQKDDLRNSIDTTKEAIRKIDQESKTQFLGALTEVNKNFKDVFTILFEGGHAELKLSDPSQPLESGIDIIAQPPGKRVQSLSLLSGGEKTLTSLAFFFGLFRYKPTPFCILDEVDAALDEINLGRFLNLMKKIKTLTQFIIITHNFKTMGVADYIYGTTMAEPNITSVYAMKLEKKVQKQE
ncbi:chromosome segregation protein SMC [Acidobacteriota bacterium]